MFSQKCSATVDDETFECCELRKDTDFGTFLSLAASSSPKPCDQYTEEDIARGSPANQSYLYEVATGHDPDQTGVLRGLDYTVEFDREAMISMYAHIYPTASAPSSAPSAATTVPSPTPRSSSDASVCNEGIVAVTLALALAALFVNN